MLKITLVRSPIANKPINRKTVRALGLRKPGRTVYREDTPSVRGMIRNVQHLLRVESVDAAPTAKAPKAAPAMKVTPPAPRPEQPKAEQPKAAGKPTIKKPAAKKKPAPKPKPTEKRPAPRKADTDRRAFGELGRSKSGGKKKES